MQEKDSNRSNAEIQAEAIINAAFLRGDDYLKLYNQLERVCVTLQAMKGWHRKGFHNLTGINVTGLLADISETLSHVDSPYDDTGAEE